MGSRLRISQDIESNIFRFIKDILNEKPLKHFLFELEQKSYNQVIRSKTKSTQAVIITESDFNIVAHQYTDLRLQPKDRYKLQECLYLTPKFPDLFLMKFVTALIQEIDLKGE